MNWIGGAPWTADYGTHKSSVRIEFPLEGVWYCSPPLERMIAMKEGRLEVRLKMGPTTTTTTYVGATAPDVDVTSTDGMVGFAPDGVVLANGAASPAPHASTPPPDGSHLILADQGPRSGTWIRGSSLAGARTGGDTGGRG